MAHLILTTNDIGAYNLRRAGVANVVIGFRLRFVSGPLPPETDLATLIETRSARHDTLGKHWLDHVRRSWVDRSGGTNLGLLDLCSAFDSIELWADPRPNDQLVLVWLLDLLRPHREIVSKLSLVQTDDDIGGYGPESLSEWKLPVFGITDDHLALASRAWNAYRAPTPERCFDLLQRNLTIFPRLAGAHRHARRAAGSMDRPRRQRDGHAGLGQGRLHRAQDCAGRGHASGGVRRGRGRRLAGRSGAMSRPGHIRIGRRAVRYEPRGAEHPPPEGQGPP